MLDGIRNSLRTLIGQNDEATREAAAARRAHSSPAQVFEVDIPSNDPLVAYFLSAPGAVEIDQMNLESLLLTRLKAEGVRLVVPLISQGELIGMLNLGARLSEQEYSREDLRLLNSLAGQAAPSLRVAQLARQQQAEAQERERLNQELRVARIIQQTLLPKDLPDLPGYHLAAYWQPARAVSGDFYDFIPLPGDKIGIVAGDVTDKGVPAALVMATTRSILRSASEHSNSPGEILARVNDLLCPDIPTNMFVTCLYMVLDPESGTIIVANAGHNLPLIRTQDGVVEMRVRGMPLGLMPGMEYEERQMDLEAGNCLLVYSDGLVEAHNPGGDMFGFPRLRTLLGAYGDLDVPSGGEALIQVLQQALNDFVGPQWEQEDDVTFVSLDLEAIPMDTNQSFSGEMRRLLAFELPSRPDNELEAMQRVAGAVEGMGLNPDRLENLKTAVAEATMNAMEHGNQYREDLPVEIEVWRSDEALSVRIGDHGGGELSDAQAPDLDAKLAGLQSPRGWGLFLIRNMVDEMNFFTDDRGRRITELTMKLGGKAHD